MFSQGKIVVTNTTTTSTKYYFPEYQFFLKTMYNCESVMVTKYKHNISKLPFLFVLLQILGIVKIYDN